MRAMAIKRHKNSQKGQEGGARRKISETVGREERPGEDGTLHRNEVNEEDRKNLTLCSNGV